MEYNQGEYEHWHFGTLDAIVDEVDADGNVIGAKDEKFLIWPD